MDFRSRGPTLLGLTLPLLLGPVLVAHANTQKSDPRSKATVTKAPTAAHPNSLKLASRTIRTRVRPVSGPGKGGDQAIVSPAVLADPLSDPVVRLARWRLCQPEPPKPNGDVALDLDPDPTKAKWIQIVLNLYNVGPHPTNQRQSYIVPPGRKARLMFAKANVRRRSPAATADQVRLELGWFDNGAGNIFQADGVRVATEGAAILYTTLWPTQNAADDRIVEGMDTPIWFPQGAKIFVNTIDLSQGGSVDYVFSAMILEEPA